MKVGDLHTEEIVFEKTKDLLLKFGVKGWNMNDLSEACNMSKRTLYKIIGTKEELLFEISKNGIAANVVRMEKYLQSNKPFHILLENLTSHIIDGFDDYTLTRINAIRIEYPRIKEIEQIYLLKNRNLYVQFFEKGINEGFIKSTVSAITIEKTLNAVIEFNLSNCNNKLEFKNEIEDLLNFIFKGILK